MIPPIEVVYARETLGTSAAGFGALMAAWGVGAVAGSALFARLGGGTVTVAAGAFKNAATNPNAAGALSPALSIDTLPPTLKLASDKAALKAGETATITFTASEAISLDLVSEEPLRMTFEKRKP